jgi:hypothetical protein
MKDLFNPTLAEEIKQRILQLRPESERLWGALDRRSNPRALHCG